MSQNLETKVAVPDLDPIRRRCRELGATFQWRRRQVDTYFAVAQGRLKLREEEGSGACLVAYRRPDVASARYCEYEIVPVAEPDPLKRALAIAPGIRVVVAKVRELWLYGHTRIHLDRVESLGVFVELETVLRDQSRADAEAEHQRVLAALTLSERPRIPGSYADLRERGRGDPYEPDRHPAP